MTHTHMLGAMIYALKVFHVLFILFVTLGWLFSWPPILMFHCFVIPSLIVHWKTNRGQCILTQLEKKFEDPKEVRIENPNTEGQFLKRLTFKVFGCVPSDPVFNGILYVFMAASFTASACKIYSSLQ